LNRLKGKVAIITGAGNGQGAFEAELFAKEGATVVATDIDFDKVSKVVEKIQAEKGTAIAIHHDISSESGWKKVVESTIGGKHFG
jgi:NAD(P)-dependent dehydrogenase (short-subunit alcohol dehydrogenase family)